MRKHMLLGVLVVGFFASSASADETYDFRFTPTINREGTSIEAFDLSFTAPAFVTSGQTPSFTPLTMTDGTHSAALTTDLVSSIGPASCFLFGTGSNAILKSDCSIRGTGPDGLFSVFFAGGLPSSDGTYNLGSGTAALPVGNSSDVTVGSVTLTISSVPEPSGIFLVPALLVAAWVTRRELSRA